MSNAALALIQGTLEQLAKQLGNLQSQGEWVDQYSSPIGKRAHLEAVRRGDLEARHVKHLRLVRRSELDAYIEKHRVRLHKELAPANESEEAALDRKCNDLLTAEPVRRRRRKGGA